MFHRWKLAKSMVTTRNATEVKHYKRWDSNSEEAKHLLELLKPGEVGPSDRPKGWTTYPIFQCFGLDAFRGGLNKLKGDLGLRVQRQSE